MELVWEILNPANAMPRLQCFPWPWWLLVAYVGANFGIAAAYFSIPTQLVLTLLYIRKLSPALSDLVTWYGRFIACCGVGHLLKDVGGTWWPNYYVFTAWDLLTFYISARTARQTYIGIQWAKDWWERAQPILVEHGLA